jgi:hypothetical protein
MKLKSVRPLGPLSLLLTSILPAADCFAEHKATSVEIAQLPPFCWAEYIDGVSGYEYSVKRPDCGTGMNHYCPGLLDVVRAKRSAGQSVQKRIGLLKDARTKTEYTLRYMERNGKLATCSLRSHAEGTLLEIETMLKALNGK